MALLGTTGFYISEANDNAGTVNGRATTGGGQTWSAGQRWHVTAGMWETRATDDGAQTYSKAAGQDWSVTASEWKVNYDNEVAFANSKTTTTVSTTAFAGTWPLSRTVYGGNLASVSAPRSGHGHVTGWVIAHSSQGGHGQSRLLVNGVEVAVGPFVGHDIGSGDIAYPVFYSGSFNNGDAVTIQLASDGPTTLESGQLALTVGAV